MGAGRAGGHAQVMETSSPLSSSSAIGRRPLLKGLGLVGAVVGVTGLTSCSSSDAAGSGSTTPAGTSAPPPAAAAGSGEITAAGVQRALAALPAIIAKNMKKTGVPGMAIAVVYDGKVRYLKGFGTRQVGRVGAVTADTVFALASVSKPLSSTVVAATLSKKLSKAGWDDPVASFLPGFTLADPWVGEHVTVADLFSHRSGLPDHAGDLLEDLGYTGEEVIAKLAQFPLSRFRDNYEYTNYGLTAAAEAVAASTGRSWPALAKRVLFDPLGMNSSSFTFTDLQKGPNWAALHRKEKGSWTPVLSGNYDGQAPAGGGISSVRDLATWLTMMLAEGTPVTGPEQLQRVWLPHQVKPGLPKIGDPASFYGHGWNVNYEPTGELRLGHSGGFGRGAATAITLYPSKKLAIAVLSNSSPLGMPEAITVEFTDIVRYGKSKEDDWLSVIAPFVAEKVTEDQKKYSKPATKPAPARPLTAYAGTYLNSLYGPMTVSVSQGGLRFTVGPAGESFRLRHYSGDDFFFRTTGEGDSGLSGARFAASSGRIASLSVNAWNAQKLGTFIRR